MTSTADTVKVHAFLASQGLGSRRTMEAAVAQGLVKVNGATAMVGQRINPATDEIRFRNQIIRATSQDLQYYLLNKPRHVVTTTNDELHRRTVLDLLPASARQYRLYPVGRLDQDSQGLVLITNDGDLAYRLTHPKFGFSKTYQVELDRAISDAALEFLRKGVKLKDGFSKPESVEVLDRTPGFHWLEITIHEGKNHHVRRMLQRAGYDVLTLIRTQFGPFTLAELGDRQSLLLDPATIRERVGD